MVRGNNQHWIILRRQSGFFVVVFPLIPRVSQMVYRVKCMRLHRVRSVSISPDDRTHFLELGFLNQPPATVTPAPLMPSMPLKAKRKLGKKRAQAWYVDALPLVTNVVVYYCDYCSGERANSPLL